MLLLRSSSLWVRALGSSWLCPATTLLQITAIGRVTQHPLTTHFLIPVSCKYLFYSLMKDELLLEHIMGLLLKHQIKH